MTGDQLTIDHALARHTDPTTSHQAATAQTLPIAPHITERSIERFAALYEEHEDGCWVWTGTGDQGYGAFGLKIGAKWKSVKAHRFSYELHVGPIPPGLQLDHLCRNRACVNPKHLEPVTNRQNSLRGHGASAMNARVTHCPQGHELAGENVIVKRTRCGWGRECRECHSERMREKNRVAEGHECPDCGHSYRSEKALNSHRGKFHRTGTKHRVWNALRGCPLTAYEAADEARAGVGSVRESIRELVRMGYVTDSGHTRPSPTGSPAIVWQITRDGYWSYLAHRAES